MIAIPSTAIGSTATRVLLHVVANPGTSVRECATAVDRAVSTTSTHLHRLRRAGLLDWEIGKQRTLHATVGVER